MRTISPVACANPLRTPAPLPWFLSCRANLTELAPLFPSTFSRSACCRNSRVPSVEQSSTMMSSFRSGTGCWATCWRSCITVFLSLKTGMMMESVWNCGTPKSSVGMARLGGAFQMGIAWTDLGEQINSENHQFRIDGMPVTGMRETYIVNQRVEDQQAGEQEDTVNAVLNGEKDR